MNNTINLAQVNIVEYVTFLAKPGISKETILQAVRQTDDILKETPGFIHRFLAYQESGIWVEVVLWENKSFAEKGLQLFLNHPKSSSFLNKILDGSVKIEYSEVL